MVETSRNSFMSRIVLSILSLSLLLAVSACGFKPVYGKPDSGTSDVSTKLASVRVENIQGREGQILKNKLEFLLNPSNAVASDDYAIRIVVKNQRRELGINTDLRVTRYDVVPNARYELVSLADNKVVDSGNVTIKSSFNRTVSEFATYVAEQNANELAYEEIAEELRSRLIYYFSK